jgi:hypothetical protein
MTETKPETEGTTAEATTRTEAAKPKETAEQTYARQTRNAVVFIALVVGVFAALLMPRTARLPSSGRQTTTGSGRPSRTRHPRAPRCPP